jgi:hypothetical protein
VGNGTIQNRFRHVDGPASYDSTEAWRCLLRHSGRQGQAVSIDSGRGTAPQKGAKMNATQSVRYTLLRVLRNGEVVVFDHKVKDFVIIRWEAWLLKQKEVLP